MPAPTPKPVVSTDIERMKILTRRMFDRLEEVMGKNPPADEQELERRRKYHEQLFGNKHSLLSVLVSLSELMLKLEQASVPVEDELPPSVPLALNPADMALVEAFLRRMHNHPPVI